MIKEGFLQYDSTMTPSFVKEAIEKNNLLGLGIFSSFGEKKIQNLKFLSEYSFLRYLKIGGLNIDFTFEFLVNMKELEGLEIYVRSEENINLGNLPNLKKLKLFWGDSIVGIDKCNSLEEAVIINYPETNLELLCNNKLIEKLILQEATNLKSLEGIENLSELKELKLFHNNKLKDIIQINSLHALETLEIDGCRNIKNFEKIQILSLKKLNVHGRFTQNIDFKNSFPNLNNFTTSIFSSN